MQQYLTDTWLTIPAVFSFSWHNTPFLTQGICSEPRYPFLTVETSNYWPIGTCWALCSKLARYMHDFLNLLNNCTNKIALFSFCRRKLRLRVVEWCSQLKHGPSGLKPEHFPWASLNWASQGLGRGLIPGHHRLLGQLARQSRAWGWVGGLVWKGRSEEGRVILLQGASLAPVTQDRLTIGFHTILTFWKYGGCCPTLPRKDWYGANIPWMWTPECAVCGSL